VWGYNSRLGPGIPAVFNRYFGQYRSVIAGAGGKFCTRWCKMLPDVRIIILGRARFQCEWQATDRNFSYILPLPLPSQLSLCQDQSSVLTSWRPQGMDCSSPVSFLRHILQMPLAMHAMPLAVWHLHVHVPCMLCRTMLADTHQERINRQYSPEDVPSIMIVLVDADCSCR